MRSLLLPPFAIGLHYELVYLQFLNSPAISDSEDDEKDNLEQGVDEAVDENGTKGDQDDRVHIYLFVCYSLSL